MRTMSMIQRVAFRLFAEQGYDATTVEQIAAAADVSPATFFRYFPAKADLLSTDEFDPLLADLRGPAGRRGRDHRDPRDGPRAVAADGAGGPGDLLDRTRLMGRSSRLQRPAVAGAAGQRRQPRRRHRDPDRPGRRRAGGPRRAAAVVSALFEVIQVWAAGDGREDLVGLTDAALGQLGRAAECGRQRPRPGAL